MTKVIIDLNSMLGEVDVVEHQTRRERKKEETRRKILETSFKLFVEQGFDSTTIDQITEVADIGKGTFYNYFSSKEAVLYEFMEYIGGEREEIIWPGIMKLQDTRKRLAKGFETLTSWLEEYPELVRAYVIDYLNSGLKTPGFYQPNSAERFMAKILKMGQEIGDIRDDMDPALLASYLMGTFLIALFRWYEQGAGPGLYKLSMECVDFFLIGALSTEK